jgi:thioredoxin-related protein
MKKSILLLILIISFFTLGCDSTDQIKCLESVKTKYPNSRIELIPGNRYAFLVIEKDYIVLVKTMDQFSTDVTYEYKISLK